MLSKSVESIFKNDDSHRRLTITHEPAYCGNEKRICLDSKKLQSCKIGSKQLRFVFFQYGSLGLFPSFKILTRNLKTARQLSKNTPTTKFH